MEPLQNSGSPGQLKGGLLQYSRIIWQVVIPQQYAVLWAVWVGSWGVFMIVPQWAMLPFPAAPPHTGGVVRGCHMHGAGMLVSSLFD